MKKHYLLLFCLFCLSMQGQITNLSEISKGRFYSSDVIKDENNNIKGYFLLFEADKVAKETIKLEYVVLDENLTKVTNGFITEMKYESWLIDAQKIAVNASLYKDELLLRLADEANGVQHFKRYRILNIKTNQISDAFIFNKDSLKVNPVFSRKNSEMSNNESERINFYQGVGMVVDSRIIDKRKKLNTRFLAHYDSDLKQVWKWNYSNITDKKLKYVSYVKSDDDVIVMFNHYTKNNNEQTYLNDHSIILVDAQKGEIRKEIDFPELDKFSYRIIDCVITEDKIYVLGNYSKTYGAGLINDREGIGLYKLVFNKRTGELLNKDYFKWESLTGKLDINKKGYVKKEGYMYTHNILLKDDGNSIVVAETFENGPILTNNMYFFELDNSFNVKEVFEVAKFRNKFPGTAAHSSTIKGYGMFDFIDYQNLGDDEYLFLLNDNEKNSKDRKKSTLYGIVSYADGKFSRQTISLKTETSKISAYNAKKGYLMLVENFDENKPSELRLEKISY